MSLFFRKIRLFVLKTNRYYLLCIIYKIYYVFAYLFLSSTVKILSLNKASILEKSPIFNEKFVPGSSDIDLTVTMDIKNTSLEFIFITLFHKFYNIMRLIFPFLDDFPQFCRKDEVKLKDPILKRDFQSFAFTTRMLSLDARFFLDDKFEYIPEKQLFNRLLNNPEPIPHLRHYIKNVDKYMLYCNKKLKEFSIIYPLTLSSLPITSSEEYQYFKKKVIRGDYFSSDHDRIINFSFWEILQIKHIFHSTIVNETRIPGNISQGDNHIFKDDCRFNKAFYLFKDRIMNSIHGVDNVLFYRNYFGNDFIITIIINPRQIDKMFAYELKKNIKELGYDVFFLKNNKLKIDTIESLKNKIYFFGEDTPFLMHHLVENDIEIKWDTVSQRHYYRCIMLKCYQRLLHHLVANLRVEYFIICSHNGKLIPSELIFEILAIDYFLITKTINTNLKDIEKFYLQKNEYFSKLMNHTLPFSFKNYKILIDYAYEILSKLGEKLEDKNHA